MTYRITFEDGKIDRERGIGPYTVRTDDYGVLAEAVHDIALHHLYNHFPEVVIEQREDEEHPVGLIFAGFRTVARFTVDEVADVAA